MEKTYTLTADEAKELSCYISMTANYRKSEAEDWDRLAQEKNSDGTPKYPKAASNAQYFRNLDIRLREIAKKLDL